MAQEVDNFWVSEEFWGGLIDQGCIQGHTVLTTKVAAIGQTDPKVVYGVHMLLKV
jgi:hypothetical protein